MVWNFDRDRRPQTRRGLARRREADSRDGGQGRFACAHPRRLVPARRGTSSGCISIRPVGRRRPFAAWRSAKPAQAYTDAIDGAVIGPCAGSCGTAAYRGAQVVVSDIATDPLWADYRELALPHGLRACWSTPIFSSEGKVIATFAMYYREPRSPSQRDQATIEQITHLAGVAIQSKRAEEAQRYHMQLLKTITDNASSMLYLVDATGRATFVNPAFERTTGYRAEEGIGQIVHDKIRHTKPDWTPYPLSECRVGEAVRQRRVLHGEELFVRKDGTFFPVQYTASPIFH